MVEYWTNATNAPICGFIIPFVHHASPELLMSSLFRDYVASVRPRGEPFRSRSMVLCLAGHHPVLSIGGNARRQSLKTTFALLCPRSPGLTPRSLFGYLIVDSLITG
jgi:hypothetical protein